MRVFWLSILIDTPSDCLYVCNIPLSGCMDRRSSYKLTNIQQIFHKTTVGKLTHQIQKTIFQTWKIKNDLKDLKRIMNGQLKKSPVYENKKVDVQEYIFKYHRSVLEFGISTKSNNTHKNKNNVGR